MPQINRIRIINFSYNNNHRNIVDETFDFYQGENALLSLKNGGGKSVLVQLLLQPILPKSKLMSRRIEDFFKGKKTPAYVLVEWKLEDQGGYLLTGIALSNRETVVREQEDANNSIKYFTFTSQYRESQPFDLQNIPLSSQEGGKILIVDFKEARKLISSKEREAKYAVKVFSDEESKEYKRYLESYNIFPDEWKSIILKINESEGGVIEIFEKCKTSLQLMNDWILRSVEKVVNKEEDDQNKLEQMLENLVGDMISNEHFIYEKDLYQAFLDQSQSFLGELNKLTDSLDEETKLERNLATLYYFLKSEMMEMQEEISRQKGVMAESEAEIKKIELEERSKDYYDVLEKVEGLIESLGVEEASLEKVRNELKVHEYEALLQKAARDFRQVKSIRVKIAGILQDISKVQSGSENKQEIQSLEYSLRLAYEKVLDKLKVKAEALDNEMKSVIEAIKLSEQELSELDSKNSELQNKVGGIRGEIKQFERDERKVTAELGLSYERNLLGEIEPSYFERYFLELDEKVINFENEKQNRLQKVEDLKQSSVQAKERVSELQEDRGKRKVDLTLLEGKMNEYDSMESTLAAIFERNQLDFKNRFSHQENQLLLNNMILQLEKTVSSLQFQIHSHSETIESLNSGTLHVSKEFSQWLTHQDIEFETGENYLRNQEPSIRAALISKNPILPYSFLLYEDDVKRLEEMDIDISIQQMVPILSFNQIDQTLVVKDHSVQVNDQLQFLCLYNTRMFNADNLDEYKDELDKELSGLNEQMEHYRRELQLVRDDLQLLKRFTFDQNDKYTLENKIKDCKADIEKYNNDILVLDGKLNSYTQEMTDYRLRIEKIKDLLVSEAERKKKAGEFIEANELYIQNLQKLTEYEIEIDRLQKEKDRFSAEKVEFTKKKEFLIEQRQDIKRKLKDTEDSYSFYQNVQEAEILNEDISVMEERLKRLNRDIQLNLERLRDDLQAYQMDLLEKENSLKSYRLKEEEYADVEFDQEKLSRNEYELAKLLGEEKKLDKAYRKIENELSTANGELIFTEREVKKLAELPLDPSQIKLNFDFRREAELVRQRQARESIRLKNETTRNYEKLTTRIEGQIDVNTHEVNTHYQVNQGVHEDFSELIKSLQTVNRENGILEKNLYKNYSDMKASFSEKNNHIENILHGFDPLLEGARSDKYKYYHLGERIIDSNKQLENLIRAYAQRLSNIEKNKNDMVQHSYLHAKQVFDEIQKIAENSSIKLEGKNRPVPMLKIDMEPLSDVTEENLAKMRSYIENCVQIIKNDMKDDKKMDEIRRKISRYMSTKELLHVLSDLGKLKIFAYKIDINVKNSTYKTWEQVMKENSGGERFVSFFAVIVALMSYTRTSMKYVDDYQRNTDTKVLIMDNPFGPISSEHLLKPLFQIAKKYNTQLICLTDLKQNSILNCFNLIYMIKIRQNVFGTNEYLQLEQQIKDDSTIQKDEKLEKAIFKVEEVEQMSLL